MAESENVGAITILLDQDGERKEACRQYAKAKGLNFNARSRMRDALLGEGLEDAIKEHIANSDTREICIQNIIIGNSSFCNPMEYVENIKALYKDYPMLMPNICVLLQGEYARAKGISRIEEITQCAANNCAWRDGADIGSIKRYLDEHCQAREH